MASCQVAFKCLTSPAELPINEGSFRALEIFLPPGKVVSAMRPAPMQRWMTYPMTIIDTIFRALAPALPRRLIAGRRADLLTAQMNGRSPRDGKLFIYNGGFVGGARQRGVRRRAHSGSTQARFISTLSQATSRRRRAPWQALCSRPLFSSPRRVGR